MCRTWRLALALVFRASRLMAGPIPSRKLINAAMLLAVQTKPNVQERRHGRGLFWAGLYRRASTLFDAN